MTAVRAQAPPVSLSLVAQKHGITSETLYSLSLVLRYHRYANVLEVGWTTFQAALSLASLLAGWVGVGCVR